jgi:ABC-type bacteriocin/lantibiotic exporter with double-glycine peptidase domain
VMAIEQIRSSLTQSVLSVGMSFFAGLSNLVVLFIYDISMAIWGVGLALLQILIIGFISIYLARRNYELSVEKGKLDGMSLDVLNGIRQARVQGSLQRVLARVMQSLTPVAQASYRIGIIQDVNRAVLRSFDGITLVVIFVLFTMHLDSVGASPMSDGGFVAFVTALSAFFGATAMLGPAISSIAEAIPQYHRLKPIMDAEPEVMDTSELKSHALLGSVSVRNAVFRYGEGLPTILDGVTVDVRRGEYVAIVGRTGCGKSTLLSMLLGLEQPESGSILYDDTPLENMDPSIVRSQIGVVMQSNSLLPGSIKSTILGVGSGRTVDDAWDASRLVGMEDEISEMPMGMLTFVGPTTLSSSQAQRLLVARALVGRPKILFLDEATSALDNHSQGEIASSIDELGCTRVVIAHRLSTIRKADRIYVLKEGRIVENGTFDELASADGHFTELMSGQLE